MKRDLTALALLLIIFTGKAQNWCAPGAEWHYRVYAPMYPYYNGYIKLNNTGTVTVSGKTCNNLSGTFYGIQYYASAPAQIVTSYAPVQTYESNGVTYFYNTNTSNFDTIADFNASIGDKWHLIKYEPANTSTCSFSSPVVTVTDTGHVFINGYNLKRLVISYQLYSSNYTDTIIERVSAITNFLFPYYHCIVDGPYYGTFVCYSDNSFPLYKRAGITVPCDYISGIPEKTNDRVNANLFPNPAEDNVYLLLGENTSAIMELSNSFGEILSTAKIFPGKTIIDLSGYCSGIYFLKVANIEGSKVFKINKH